MLAPAKARRGTTAADPPLSTLLSQVLVAFTIEFDNEFERQMPHRTTSHGATTGTPHAPWLVSMVMWSNFLRFIPEDGISARELLAATGLKKEALRNRLQRLARWWGYLIVTPAPDGSGWMVRPSIGGRQAQQIWQSLPALIENRWQQRFGKEEIGKLRQSLSAVVSQLDIELPEYLPILGPVWSGWFAEAPRPREGHAASTSNSGDGQHLPALLARTLLAFTLDTERETDLSLAISANMIRVLNDTGVPIRDLPRLTGVSKEAIKMMLGFLGKHGYLVIEQDPQAARTRLVRLTAKGLISQDAFRSRLRVAEEQWQARFGNENIRNLREMLEHLAGKPAAGPSPLFAGLQLHPEGWRAALPKPETLPHYPLVLHRGGFPDGS